MTAARLISLAAAMLLPISALTQNVTDLESRGSDRTLTANSAEAATPVHLMGARTSKRVQVRVLPQIAQPGKKVASPDKARVAVIVTVKPENRTVVRLQVKTGTRWKNLRSATSSPEGKHVFLAALKRGGTAATYRVRAGGKVSRAVSTTRWLTPSFSDTFNGRRLSKAWEHRVSAYNPTVRRCSRGDARGTRVRGGTVRLSVIKDPKRKTKCTALRNGQSTGRYAYRLNGNIGTQSAYTFTYGIAAARVKFPKQSGQHAAFWLQVDSPDLRRINAKRNGTEIDVIESYGINAGNVDGSLGLTTGVHRYIKHKGEVVTKPHGGWVKNAKQYLTGRNDSFFTGYHVFSVEWTPDFYIYRIDGKEYWRTHKGISGTPQFPVLSILSSDYEIYRLQGGDKSLPQHMNVDWLRVWETGPGSGR